MTIFALRDKWPHRWIVGFWMFTWLTIGLAGPAATAQQTDPPSNPAAATLDAPLAFDSKTQLECFDIVWKTVRQAHWDRDYVEQKWEGAREKYRPQVEQAENIKQVRKILNEMLDALGQSHYGIIPFETYAEMEKRSRSGGEGFSGLGFRLIADQLVVTRVAADSPAAQAGVQTGWVLVKVGDRTVSDLIEKTQKIVEHSSGRVETYAALAAEARATGAIGEQLKLEFVDHDDQPQSIELQLVKGPGKFARFGHLPPTAVVFRSRELPEQIGYIGFNTFLDGPGLMSQYNRALEGFRDSQGLIIDLRGNRGGLVILVNGMCGWFIEERQSLGTMTMAGNALQLSLNPRKPRFDKPLAVLIDDCSISAAEIMSGGLRDLGLARVFGGRSAGLVLPSTVIKLPNGDGFQFVVANYASASGKVLEGEGVEPHEVIEFDRADLKGNRDPVLERASQWIIEQNQSTADTD